MANGRIVAFVAIGADLVVGYLALSRWVWNSAWPEGLIQANGRIEDDHVTIASKFPGYIQELLVQERAPVREATAWFWMSKHSLCGTGSRPERPES